MSCALTPGTAPLAMGVHGLWCLQQTLPGTPLRPRTLRSGGGSTRWVGTAEWLWQPRPCFPLEAVAVSDCQGQQPQAPWASWEGVTLALLWIHIPPLPQNGTWHWEGEGGRLYLAAGWHGWEGVVTGRELLPALQPGCFQSGCYSMGISLGTLPSPSPTQCRGPGSPRDGGGGRRGEGRRLESECRCCQLQHLSGLSAQRVGLLVSIKHFVSSLMI